MIQADVKHILVTNRQSLSQADSKKDKDIFFQLLLTFS